jgi:hypothetical protein
MAERTLDDADDVLVDYIAHANAKSNEDLKRYPRRHLRFHDEVVELTATWRALSILERVLLPDPPNRAVVRQLIRRAQARLRAVRRRMSEKGELSTSHPMGRQDQCGGLQ